MLALLWLEQIDENYLPSADIGASALEAVCFHFQRMSYRSVRFYPRSCHEADKSSISVGYPKTLLWHSPAISQSTKILLLSISQQGLVEIICLSCAWAKRHSVSRWASRFKWTDA